MVNDSFSIILLFEYVNYSENFGKLRTSDIASHYSIFNRCFSNQLMGSIFLSDDSNYANPLNSSYGFYVSSLN
jgi:hypothetical protein